MINSLKSAVASAFKATTPYQFLSACSNRTSSVFNRYVLPSFNFTRKEIDILKMTQKLVKEHKEVMAHVEANIPIVIAKDLESIQKLSAMLANDLIIHCFPSLGSNHLYQEFYYSKAKGFSDFVLEKAKKPEPCPTPEYRARKMALNSLSNHFETIILDALSSKDYPLFKGNRLTQNFIFSDKLPYDFQDLIKSSNNEDSIPRSILVSLNYEKGVLTARLKVTGSFTNKWSIPVPHIAQVGDQALQHFQGYKAQETYHNGLYAKIIKRLNI